MLMGSSWQFWWGLKLLVFKQNRLPPGGSHCLVEGSSGQNHQFDHSLLVWGPKHQLKQATKFNNIKNVQSRLPFTLSDLALLQVFVRMHRFRGCKVPQSPFPINCTANRFLSACKKAIACKLCQYWHISIFIKGSLVAELPSYGWLSWLEFPQSCQPNHHVNHPSSSSLEV